MPRILVVEDHSDSCEAMARFLRRSGYEVECASSGQTALHQIISHAPDLLVLDLGLPDMDGPRLLEILRSYQRLRSLPVVVWTAVSDSWLVTRARCMKVNSVITKGAGSFDRVLDAIDKSLPPAILNE